MKIVSTNLTRHILNFVIGLHRRALVSECGALDRRADDLFDAADQQKRFVDAEQERLEAIRLEAFRAGREADDAWRAANTELAQYPCAPLIGN